MRTACSAAVNSAEQEKSKECAKEKPIRKRTYNMMQHKHISDGMFTSYPEGKVEFSVYVPV